MAATLFNRLSVWVPGVAAWVDLPFFDGDFTPPVPVHEGEWIPIPGGAPKPTGLRRTSYATTLNFRYIEDDVRSGLERQDYIWSAFYDSSGNARDVDVALWTDTTAAIDRIMLNASLSGPVRFGASTTEKHRPYSVPLRFLSLGAVGRNSDYPTTHEYELYVYGSTGAGGVPTLSTEDRFQIPMHFADKAQVAGATNLEWQHEATVPGPAASTVRLERVAITGAHRSISASSGSTTLRASNSNYASAGSGINCSVAYNATNNEATGSVDFTAGDTVYLYVTDATGDHSAINAVLYFRVL